MQDEWTETLRCPSCEKTGIASLSQNDLDAPPSVHAVPDGFRVVDGEHGPNFFCEACGMEAEP
jgi:hypothetical protein